MELSGHEQEYAQNADSEEVKQKNSASDLLHDFATSTTAHGISRIASAKEIRFKIVWFIIWLGVISFFIYMTTTLIILYKSKPVSTSVSIEFEQPLRFPAVTVCNLNMFRQSSITDLKSGAKNIFKTSPGSRSQAARSSGLNFPENLNTSTSLSADDFESAKVDILATINSLNADLRYKKGYRFQDLIKYCSIGGLVCHSGYLKNIYWRRTWNWRYGTCFTFNGISTLNGTNVDVLNSSSSGVSDGLSLSLDIIRSEYVSEISTEEGVRVLISDQDTALHPSEEGFSVSPGVVAGIGLKKAIIEREDTYQNGSCKSGFLNGFRYSMKHCFMVCKGLTQQQYCNCTETNFMLILNTRPCIRPAAKTCISMLNQNFSRGDFDCSKECPQQCSSTKYKVFITQGKIYPPGYMSSVGNITAVGQNDTRASSSYVQDNIVQLRIYFIDNTVEKIATKSYYQIDNLISDIGGQLGLWIGVSAVTCVEFLAFTWTLMNFLIKKQQKRKIENKKNDHS